MTRVEEFRPFELLLAAAGRGETVRTAKLVAAPPCHAAAVGQMMLFYPDGRVAGELADAGLTALAVAELKYAAWPGPCLRPLVYEGDEYRVFWDSLGHDAYRSVILGGGHISQPLAAMLAMLGHAVTVVDDRPDFANKGRFPQAEVVCDDFRRFLAGLNADEKTAVVIVTRGHQHDLACLRAAATLPAGYIGMIGSRRKVRAIFDILADEGVEPSLLERVRAPVGLDIGAQGPAEIALSIAAEIVAVIRGGDGRLLSGKGAGCG